MSTPFDALAIEFTLVDSGKVFDCLSVSYEAALQGRYDLRVLVVGDVKSQAFGRASSALKLGWTCRVSVSSERFDHQMIFEGRLFALKGTSTFANGMELVSLHIVPECQVLFLNQRSGIYYGGSVLDVIDQGLPQPVVKSLIRNKDSAYPSQKSITQYGECDMEFILRQLAEYGITFNVYQDFEKGGMNLRVSDHNGAFPDRGEIPILKAGESESAGLFNVQWTIQAKSDVVRGIHFVEEENRYLIETQSLGHIKDKAVWDHHTLGNQLNIKQLQVLTAALRDSMKVQEDTLTAHFQGLNLQQGEIIHVNRHGVMTPYLIEAITYEFKKGESLKDPPFASSARGQGGQGGSDPLAQRQQDPSPAQYQQFHTLTAKSLKYWRDNTPLTYYPKHRYTNYRYRGILSGCYGVTDQAVVVPDKLGNIPVDFPYNYRRVCGKVPARYTRVISWSNQGGKTGRTFPIYKDTELQILFVNNNMDYPMIKGAAANADTGHVNNPDVDRRTHWALPQGQYLTYSNVPGDRNFIAMGTKHSEDAHRSFTLLTNYPNQDNPNEKQLDHLQATTGSREQSTLQNSHILHGKGVTVMPPKPDVPVYNQKMHLSPTGWNTLRTMENSVSHYYNDAATAQDTDPTDGNCTFGTGHLYKQGPCGSLLGQPVSDAEIRQIFQNDVSKAEKIVKQHIQKVQLTQAKFDALVCFTFNEGVQPLLDQINGGAPDHFVRAHMVTYDKAKNQKTDKYEVEGGLIKRCQWEAVAFGYAGPFYENQSPQRQHGG